MRAEGRTTRAPARVRARFSISAKTLVFRESMLCGTPVLCSLWLQTNAGMNVQQTIRHHLAKPPPCRAVHDDCYWYALSSLDAPERTLPLI